MKFVKKAVALISLLTLVLTAATVSVFAEEVSKVQLKDQGAFCDTVVFDGNLAEWSTDAAQKLELKADSFTAWAGEGAEGDMTLYFALDDEYLYVAADITDTTKHAVSSSDTAGHYAGRDAFQIAVDFNSVFASYAGDVEESFSRSCFYSFARREDGKMSVTTNEVAPEDLKTVWADADGTHGIKGACAEKEGGWTAEIAIELNLLLEHAVNKLESVGETEKAEELNAWDKANGCEIGALVCYIDYGTDGQLKGAFGVGKYADMSEGEQSGFRPENHGIKLMLSSIGAEDEETDGSGAPTDKATDVTETTTDKPTESTTPEKEGCGASIAAVPVAIVSVFGIALALKKNKED